MKGQMKMAGKSGAEVALIVGPDEADADTVSVRSLTGEGTTQQIVSRSDLVTTVKEIVQ
jgi:histidyl-tRNA synthetase